MTETDKLPSGRGRINSLVMTRISRLLLRSRPDGRFSVSVLGSILKNKRIGLR